MTATPSPRHVWDDSFRVGVPELDDQHRNLFRLLAALAEALDEGGHAVPGELEELLRDCAVHFADEEVYLAGAAYPDLVKQQVQHRIFVRRLTALAERVRRGEETFGEETLDGLTSWLRGHILGLDREYAEYLRNRVG